jgi:hypothetical protein
MTTVPTPSRYGVFFKRDYQFQIVLSLFISVVALGGVLSVFIELIFKKSVSPSILIGSIIALGFGLLMLFDTVNTLLIISSEGIEYRRGGYTLSVTWQDIERIEVRLRRRLEYVLVLKKSTLVANRWETTFLQLTKTHLVIPLSLFAINWHRTKIGELIRHHAPHMKMPE